MIADYAAKLLYVTPPRTGSRALHRWLCQAPNCVWVVGPSFCEALDHHTVYPPAGTKTFKWVLVTRNPTVRFLSLFRCLNAYYSERGCPSTTLESFVSLVEEDNCSLHPMYRRTVTDYAKLAERQGAVWHEIIPLVGLAKRVSALSNADPKLFKRISEPQQLEQPTIPKELQERIVKLAAREDAKYVPDWPTVL